MNNNNNSRIEISYYLIFGTNFQHNVPEDMLNIHSLHYILSNKDVNLSIDSKTGKKYEYRILPSGNVFSKNLYRDISLNLLDESYYLFDTEEMHIIESLSAILNTLSKQYKVTNQNLLCAMAGYHFINKNLELSNTEIQQTFTLFMGDNKTLQQAKQAVETFDNLTTKSDDCPYYHPNQIEF